MGYRSFLLMVMGFIWMAPAFAHGATYYVAKTGSNNYTCTQAQSALTPKLTVTAGIGCLSAGDTLIVQAGTYDETIREIIPAGTSPSARTRIIGNAGAKWTLRPTSLAQCGTSTSAVIVSYGTDNVELADLILDANGLCKSGMRLNNGSDDWWIHHSEVTGWAGAELGLDGSGIAITTGNSVYSKRALIQHVYSHDGGFGSLDHCFYIKGDDHIIEHVEGARCSGHGMHMYGGNGTGAKNNRNIVRYSYFHNNGSRGILIGSGDGNIAHHNVSANNGADGVSIGFNTTTNNKVYNNTIYSNNTECVDIRAGATGSKVKNNLCLSNTNNIVATAARGLR